MSLECHYDNCEEEFETSNDRLFHVMDEHWPDIDPYNYTKLHGKSRFG